MRRVEPVHVRRRDPHQHVGGEPARGVVHPCSGKRAPGCRHRVRHTAGPAGEAVADHASGEHAPRVTSWLELAGRGHLLRDPEVPQRGLHALHHRPLGHPVTLQVETLPLLIMRGWEGARQSRSRVEECPHGRWTGPRARARDGPAAAQAVAGARGRRPARDVDRARSASAASPAHRRGRSPRPHGLRGRDPIGRAVIDRSAGRRAEGRGGGRRLLRPRGQRTRVTGAGAGLRAACAGPGDAGTPRRRRGAVLDWARTAGHQRLWATVWDWNTASRRVLAKLGFAEIERQETVHGTNCITTRRL